MGTGNKRRSEENEKELTLLAVKRGPKPYKVKATDAFGVELVFDSVEECARYLSRSASWVYAAVERGLAVRGVRLERLGTK